MDCSSIDPAGVQFPQLAGSSATRTSDPDEGYNCIAWAAEDNERIWWPVQHGAWWPVEPIPPEPTVDAFVRGFRELGYEPVRDGEHDPSIEKLAIYVKDGEVTHMARQLANGRWTSKIGKNVDIEHPLDALENGDYGSVHSFLGRTRPATGLPV